MSDLNSGQPRLYCHPSGASARRNLQLRKDVAEMVFDRFRAEHQSLGNLAVCFCQSHQAEDLYFASGQAADSPAATGPVFASEARIRCQGVRNHILERQRAALSHGRYRRLFAQPALGDALPPIEPATVRWKRH